MGVCVFLSMCVCACVCVCMPSKVNLGKFPYSLLDMLHALHTLVITSYDYSNVNGYHTPLQLVLNLKFPACDAILAS